MLGAAARDGCKGIGHPRILLVTHAGAMDAIFDTFKQLLSMDYPPSNLAQVISAYALVSPASDPI